MGNACNCFVNPETTNQEIVVPNKDEEDKIIVAKMGNVNANGTFNTYENSEIVSEEEIIIGGNLELEQIEDGFNIELQEGKEYDINTLLLNSNIVESEKKLGPYQQQESSNTVKGLKKYCFQYIDQFIYNGYYNKYWEKEGFGDLYILLDNTMQTYNKLTGEFVADQLVGIPRIIFNNGDYYIGGLDENYKFYGQGCYTTFNGKINKGIFRQGIQCGLGEEIIEGKYIYKGNFENGLKHGIGKIIFESGNQYEGEFEEDEITGFGIMNYENGKTFKGGFLKGLMNGKGVFKWPDNQKYIGEYKDDKRNGFGIFYWPDGKIYQGTWENGRMHGNGLYGTADKKLGNFVNGRKIRWVENNEVANECVDEIEQKTKCLLESLKEE